MTVSKCKCLIGKLIHKNKRMFNWFPGIQNYSDTADFACAAFSRRPYPGYRLMQTVKYFPNPQTLPWITHGLTNRNAKVVPIHKNRSLDSLHGHKK